MKSLSVITIPTLDHDGLADLKAFIISVIDALVSNEVRNSETISLCPLPSITSIRYSGMRNSLSLYVASKGLLQGNN